MGEVCALLAAGMAALALWSWVAGVSELFTTSDQHIPMATTTALLLAWVSVAVFLQTRWPAQKSVVRFGYSTAVVVAAAGLLACLRPRFGWGSPIEQWLAHSTDEIGGVPIGQMSPLTGGAFVVASLALFFRLAAGGRRSGTRWISLAFAVGVALLGAGVVAGYILGKPRVVGDYLIPMALWTATAFTLLGLALATSPVIANSSTSVRGRRFGGMPWVLAVSMALVVGLVGALYLRNEKAKLRTSAGDMLEAIGELKANQIVRWREERMGDASFFANASFAVRNVQSFFANPAAEFMRVELVRWLKLLKAGDRYSLLALYDTNAVLRLVLPKQTSQRLELSRSLMAEAFRTNHVVMSDLYRGPNQGDIQLDVVVPLLAQKPATNPEESQAGLQSETRPQKEYQPVGVLLMRIDPQRYLYPLIQSWPVPSRTAEMVLFRRDGNDVLILNELRHRTNTALALRLPINSASDLTAAKAVLGQTGRIEGRDYRGVPVVAVARPIPDSTWFIITKVDRAEVYAPLRPQAWLILAMTVVLAAAAGLLVRTLSARQQRASERQRLAMAERVEHLMKSANDAIIIADEQNRILEANDRALELYGYTLADLQAIGLVRLRPMETRTAFTDDEQELKAAGRSVFETLHQRKDGSVFPVEVSSRVIEIGGQRFKLGILRDITQRKAHEREIARLTRLYATLSQINQSIVRVNSRRKLFQQVCKIAVEYGGFKLAWIGGPEVGTQRVKPLAYAGAAEGYLESSTLRTDDSPEGRGPVGLCLREGKACVFNDFITDDRALPWRKGALAHGLRAVAAIPIHLEGEVFGAFTVYSDEPGVFQDKEIALLEEIALDISFALEHLAQEEKRRQAEAALRESETFTRTVLDNLPVGIAVNSVSPSVSFTYMNDNFSRFYRTTREKLADPDAFWSAVYEDLEFRETMRRRVLEDCASGDAERMYWADIPITRKGEKTTFVTARNISLPEKSLMISTVWDVTTRKEAEEALRVAHDRLRRFVDADIVGVVIANTAGAILEANDYYLNLIGFTREEFSEGKVDWRAITPTEWLAVDEKALRELRERSSCTPYEKEYIRRDGLRVPVLLVDALLPGPEEHIVAFVLDLTGRKQAEVELRKRLELQNQLAQTAATVPGMIYSFRLRPDGATSLPYASGALEAVFDLQPDRLRDDATPLFANIHSEDVARVKESIAESARTLKSWRTEFRVNHPSRGELWLEGHSMPQREPDGSILWHGYVQDITERKKQEQALHDSEHLLRTVMDLVPHFIFAKDRNSRHLFMNRACAAASGMTPEQMTGLRDPDFIKDRAQAEAFMRDDCEVIDSGKPKFVAEERLTDASGQTRILQTIKIPCHVPGADGPALVGVAVDITGIKNAEGALRESDERLKLALAASRMGVWEWDLRTNAIFWSPESYAMVGMKPTDEPLTLETFTNLVHPEDRARVLAAAEQAVATKMPFAVEFRLLRADGRMVWLGNEARCTYDAAGKPLRLLGTVQDITARKEANAELRKLSRAVEQSPASVVITSPAGEIEYVNPKFTAVTGYTLAEVRGKNPRILKSGDMSADAYRKLWQTITRGEVWRGEFHNRKKNGELFWESAAVCPVVDELGHITHFLAVKEDITERKRLEDQLRQSQKLEAVGQLAGGVAHDFNNILAATMMQLGLLKERPNLDGELREALHELDSHAERAAALTRQLLLFSRRSVMQTRSLDLNEVVENLLKMLRRLIGEHIKLEWHGQSHLSPITADTGMIEQVVMNLVVNARDAMPKGGRLNLATEVVEITAEQIRDRPDARPGRYVCLCVADTGCGMDEATLKRIFEPFFTTKEAGKGTGLGLATIYGIVSQHGGWVAVESQVNKGATFRVYLPATVATAKVAVLPPKTEPIRGADETILLVEDDAAVRITISAFLRRWGYQVLVATNGVEAVKLWEEHQERISLLFTDMVMPEGMTGLELAQQLRLVRPDLKVIISSGYSADLLQQGNLAAERIVYVPKPCPAVELSLIIRRCLGKT